MREGAGWLPGQGQVRKRQASRFLRYAVAVPGRVVGLTDPNRETRAPGTGPALRKERRAGPRAGFASEDRQT